MQRGSPHPKDVLEVPLQPVGHLRLLGDLQRQAGDPPAVNLHPQEEVQRGSLHRKDVQEVLPQPVGHLRLLGDLQPRVGDPLAVNLHLQEGLQVGNRQLPRRGQAYPR